MCLSIINHKSSIINRYGNWLPQSPVVCRESRTLKDKRQVVRSIIDRVRHEFNVSACEVDTHDDVKLVTLGFAAVGFENATIQGVLQKIADALRTTRSRSISGVKWRLGVKLCDLCLVQAKHQTPNTKHE